MRAPTSLGAGPGPIKRYYVDVGVPGGSNVPVDVPVQAIAQDFATALQPTANQWAQGIASEVGAQVEASVSKPIQDALASGNLVVQQASSKVGAVVVVISVLAGAVGGFMWAKRRR